jgi:hypothetical protein
MPRGRITAQALTISGNEVFRIPRPQPPAELEPAEADQWRLIVGASAPERFPPDTHPMLVGYCRKAVGLENIASRIKEISSHVPMDDDLYLRWKAVETAEIRALTLLATKLRLAPSTYEDRRLKKPETVDQPWREDS